jgi:hypothetical protein
LIDSYEEGGWYVNKRTGEVFFEFDEILEFVEEHLDELLDEDEDAIEQVLEAQAFGFGDPENIPELAADFDDLQYIEPLDTHEQYEIMEEYADLEEDEKIRSLLYVALDGRGAFRRFKDALSAIGKLSDYYDYRDHLVSEKAREWCEDNGIPAVTQ